MRVIWLNYPFPTTQLPIFLTSFFKVFFCPSSIFPRPSSVDLPSSDLLIFPSSILKPPPFPLRLVPLNFSFWTMKHLHAFSLPNSFNQFHPLSFQPWASTPRPMPFTLLTSEAPILRHPSFIILSSISPRPSSSIPKIPQFPNSPILYFWPFPLRLYPFFFRPSSIVHLPLVCHSPFPPFPASNLPSFPASQPLSFSFPTLAHFSSL